MSKFVPVYRSPERLAEAVEEGVMLGVGVGVFVGNLFLDNVGLGIALGIGVSPLLGVGWHILLDRLLPPAP